MTETNGVGLIHVANLSRHKVPKWFKAELEEDQDRASRPLSNIVDSLAYIKNDSHFTQGGKLLSELTVVIPSLCILAGVNAQPPNLRSVGGHQYRIRPLSSSL